MSTIPFLQRFAPISPSTSSSDIRKQVNAIQLEKKLSTTTPYVKVKYTRWQDALDMIMRQRRHNEDPTQWLEKAQALERELDYLLQYRKDMGCTRAQWTHQLHICLKLEARCRASEYLHFHNGTGTNIDIERLSDDEAEARQFCTRLRDHLIAEEQAAYAENSVSGTLGEPLISRLMKKPTHSELLCALGRIKGLGIHSWEHAKEYIKSYASRASDNTNMNTIEDYIRRHDWNGLGKLCVRDEEYVARLLCENKSESELAQAAIRAVRDQWLWRYDDDDDEEEEEEGMIGGWQMHPVICAAFVEGLRRFEDLKYFADLHAREPGWSMEEVKEEVGRYIKERKGID